MSKNFYQVSYLDMIVLKLLNDRDMYGYEIMDELSQRSQGRLRPEGRHLIPRSGTADGTGAGRSL